MSVRVSFAMTAWVADCTTKEEIIDRLAMAKFISLLDRETAQWTNIQAALVFKG